MNSSFFVRVHGVVVGRGGGVKNLPKTADSWCARYGQLLVDESSTITLKGGNM
jgi:hypothetical protein